MFGEYYIGVIPEGDPELYDLGYDWEDYTTYTYVVIGSDYEHHIKKWAEKHGADYYLVSNRIYCLFHDMSTLNKTKECLHHLSYDSEKSGILNAYSICDTINEGIQKIENNIIKECDWYDTQCDHKFVSLIDRHEYLSYTGDLYGEETNRKN